MKKILFILTLIIVTAEAKPCMTDIYFGNGVWNTRTQGREGTIELRDFMLYTAITRLDSQNEAVTYNFKHAYNPSHGTLLDLVETFWQLKESGQISDGYFHSIYASLMSSRDGNHYYDRLQQIISTYNEDSNTMFTAYKTSSFDQKHNVLLVAHSQGNLFGNKMYALLTSEQKKKFRMVSVATPAGYVMQENQTNPYVTATLDYIIGPIPGSLPGNVDGIGHTFVGTYLNSSINAPRKIALYVKNAYDDLMQTTSCIVYEAVYMKIYDVDTLEVYAFTTNTFPRYHDLLDTIALETYDATRDSSNNELTCGSPTYRLSPNTAFSSCTYETGTSCSWKPGALYKDVLEQRKGTTHHVLHNGKCTTLSLSGELYDLVENALR